MTLSWHEAMAQRLEGEMKTVESVLLGLVDEKTAEVPEEHYDLHESTYRVRLALRKVIDELESI